MPRKKKPANKITALETIPKTRLGRPCSICTHLAVEKINKAIRKGTSFRGISRQIVSDDSMQHSIRRHAEKCLKLDIHALLEDQRIDRAVNHYKELRADFDFVRELGESAKDKKLPAQFGKTLRLDSSRRSKN